MEKKTIPHLEKTLFFKALSVSLQKNHRNIGDTYHYVWC